MLASRMGSLQLRRFLSWGLGYVDLLCLCLSSMKKKKTPGKGTEATYRGGMGEEKPKGLVGPPPVF